MTNMNLPMITVAATTTAVAVAIEVVVVIAETVPITTEALYIFFFNVRSYFTNAMSPHQKNTIQRYRSEERGNSLLTHSLTHSLPPSLYHSFSVYGFYCQVHKSVLLLLTNYMNFQYDAIHAKLELYCVFNLISVAKQQF